MSLLFATTQLAFTNHGREKEGLSGMKSDHNSCLLFIDLRRLASKRHRSAYWCFVKSTLQNPGLFTGATCIGSPSCEEVQLFLSFCCRFPVYKAFAEPLQHVKSVGKRGYWKHMCGLSCCCCTTAPGRLKKGRKKQMLQSGNGSPELGEQPWVLLGLIALAEIQLKLFPYRKEILT